MFAKETRKMYSDSQNEKLRCVVPFYISFPFFISFAKEFSTVPYFSFNYLKGGEKWGNYVALSDDNRMYARFMCARRSSTIPWAHSCELDSHIEKSVKIFLSSLQVALNILRISNIWAIWMRSKIRTRKIIFPVVTANETNDSSIFIEWHLRNIRCVTSAMKSFQKNFKLGSFKDLPWINLKVFY